MTTSTNTQVPTQAQARLLRAADQELILGTGEHGVGFIEDEKDSGKFWLLGDHGGQFVLTGNSRTGQNRLDAMWELRWFTRDEAKHRRVYVITAAGQRAVSRYEDKVNAASDRESAERLIATRNITDDQKLTHGALPLPHDGSCAFGANAIQGECWVARQAEREGLIIVDPATREGLDARIAEALGPNVAIKAVKTDAPFFAGRVATQAVRDHDVRRDVNIGSLWVYQIRVRMPNPSLELTEGGFEHVDDYFLTENRSYPEWFATVEDAERALILKINNGEIVGGEGVRIAQVSVSAELAADHWTTLIRQRQNSADDGRKIQELRENIRCRAERESELRSDLKAVRSTLTGLMPILDKN